MKGNIKHIKKIDVIFFAFGFERIILPTFNFLKIECLKIKSVFFWYE